MCVRLGPGDAAAGAAVTLLAAAVRRYACSPVLLRARARGALRTVLTFWPMPTITPWWRGRPTMDLQEA